MPEKSTNIIDSIVSIFTSKEIIIAAIGGAIGTFAAPWTKWKFEKEKIQLENRKEKIRKWREEIDKSEDYNSFRETATFHELKGRFTNKELESFGTYWLEISSNFSSSAVNSEKTKLGKFHEVVSQIEKEWKIV